MLGRRLYEALIKWLSTFLHLQMATASQRQKGFRFSNLSPSDECALLQAATPEKTKLVTEYRLRVVSSFAREKDLSIDIKTVSPEVLNDFLKKFYGGLRTRKGETYS